MTFNSFIRRFTENIGLPFVSACVVYTLLLIVPGKLLNDGDTLWHIVIGERILESWRLPHEDHYSYSLPGEPYRTNSWLSDVLLGFAYSVGGFAGVVTLTILCVSATIFLLQREYLRWLSNKTAIYMCAIVVVMLAPHILSRPHVLIFPVATLWVLGLVRSDERGEAPSLYLLPLLFLWANMHGSFLLGVILTTVFFAKAVLEGRVRAKNQKIAWGLFILGSATSIIVGPYGFYPLITALDVLSVGNSLNNIEEWKPQDFSAFSGFEAALLLFVGVLMYYGVTIEAGRIVILVGLLHMALSHARHADFLAIFGSILIVSPLGKAMRGRDIAINSGKIASVAVPIALLGTLAIWTSGAVAPTAFALPEKALVAARSEGVAGRVFNDYAFGGALIFKGERVYVDSRAEFYGRDFLAHYTKLVSLRDEAALIKFLNDTGIGWTILTPGRPVVETLNKIPGWRQIYADDVAVVHMRAK